MLWRMVVLKLFTPFDPTAEPAGTCEMHCSVHVSEPNSSSYRLLQCRPGVHSMWRFARATGLSTRLISHCMCE